MICKKCGAQIPKGSKFCPECGCKIKKKRKNNRSKISVALRVAGWIIVIGAVLAAIIIPLNNDLQQAMNKVQSKQTPVNKTVSTTVTTPDLAKKIIGKWKVIEVEKKDNTVKKTKENYLMVLEFRQDKTFLEYIMDNDNKTQSVTLSHYYMSGNNVIFDDKSQFFNLTMSDDRLIFSFPQLDQVDSDYKDALVVCTRTFSIPIEYNVVSSKKLNQDYQENEIAADNKYLNNYIEVSGKIVSVRKGLFNYIVGLDADGYGIYTIDCQFKEDQVDSLASLKTGQYITIVGICKGKNLAGVTVENCKIF